MTLRMCPREHFQDPVVGRKFHQCRASHRVWTAVNLTQIDLLRQLKKVKDNLTEQVIHRSQRLETKIEIEEQKSNNASLFEEQHSKKIQGLENLLNVTRHDIKNVSREHFKTLWLAGNFTNAELHRVWTAMNLTQIDLLRQLKKVKDNLTETVEPNNSTSPNL
ncbi:hypothetical protein OS493_035152 [Desmophyllum pertusum]|uniref:Uncharacterized protein n=1 Tax=Desmophyllum pertusum TaxID=174260 RepID=A0A9W9YII2_9CNID|nr:hypothetical protein OS493_035152 [Desmophyllum pertusum]